MQLCRYCFGYWQGLEEESERVAVEKRKLLMKCVMCWDCGWILLLKKNPLLISYCLCSKLRDKRFLLTHGNKGMSTQQLCLGIIKSVCTHLIPSARWVRAMVPSKHYKGSLSGGEPAVFSQKVSFVPNGFLWFHFYWWRLSCVQRFQAGRVFLWVESRASGGLAGWLLDSFE